MLFPIGDTPNPKNYFPVVNWCLIVLNVAVYLFVTLPKGSQPVDPTDPALQEYLKVLAELVSPNVSLREVLRSISAYDLVVFSYGFKPGAPEVSDLFTSMFLHGGLAHLIGNMLFLWIFGDNVEHRLGRIGYLTTYLATGVIATLAFSLIDRESLRPLVGASGAISGVLGIYFLLFRRNRVKIFVFLFPILFDVILLPARWVLGFFVVVDNLLPFLLSSQSSVAHGAHLGGFAAGLAVAFAGEALAWRLPWQRARLRESKSDSGDRPLHPPEPGHELDDLRAAIEADDRVASLERVRYLELKMLSRLRPSQCARLASWLDEAGQRPSAVTVLRQCIGSHRRGTGDREMASVYLALGQLRLHEGQETAAYQHLLTALELDPGPETALKARAALEQIDVYRRQ